MHGASLARFLGRAHRDCDVLCTMHAFDLSAFLDNLLHFGAFDPSSHPVSLLEKILRPLIVYLILIVCLRVAGRRMLAQLNPFDLVVLLMLSNTVQNAIIGNDTSLLGGIIGAVSLLATNALVVRALYRGPQHAAVGEADDDCLLIKDGKLNDTLLRKLGINVAELTVKAHERGFNSLKEVEKAIIFPTGTIYFDGRDSTHSQRQLAEILTNLTALRKELREQTS